MKQAFIFFFDRCAIGLSYLDKSALFILIFYKLIIEVRLYQVISCQIYSIIIVNIDILALKNY